MSELLFIIHSLFVHCHLFIFGFGSVGPLDIYQLLNTTQRLTQMLKCSEACGLPLWVLKLLV